ncbi:hypothetical protein, conserved [Eimeria tenella]|uniref:EF-hand domain-containing protein n=1 Tax=Eimeria tenella TaxID=5802 RepID=U6KPN1_EIMTE|nr:hypothetical protein, conserved [Eimeria tenella]CDJ37388.1 hypothetical protein, conserved [Eimeria tenella]|eukprot:XP_013228226.1 hypothetical protein, conserved [Eimeria tenella]
MAWRWDRVAALFCVQLAVCLGVQGQGKGPQECRFDQPCSFLRVRVEAGAKAETREEYVENWVAVGLFVVIILLSVVFEVFVGTFEEYLRRRRLAKLQEMLNCAFKELTILGFISLFLYATIRLGAARKLNDKYLGVSKTEEAAVAEAEARGEEPYPPTHLTETFETIHVLIFMIMLAFLLQVAALTALGHRTMRALELLDSESEEELHAAAAALLQLQPAAAAQLQQALQHWALRQRFVFAANPLMPKPRLQQPGSPAFSFAAYLNYCFGESLAAMIELPPSVLVLALLLLLLLRPALSLSGREVIAFMAAAAFLLLLLTYFSFAFLNFVDSKLRPDSGALLALFGAPPEALPGAPGGPPGGPPGAPGGPPGGPQGALHCPIDESLHRRAAHVLLRTRLLRTFTTAFHLDFLASAKTIRAVEAEQDKGGKIENAAAVQRQSLLAAFRRLPREAQAYIRSLFTSLAEHSERFPHAEAPGVVSRQAMEDIIRCTRMETRPSSGYLQFEDFKAFVVLLGSLGVDKKEYPQHQRATLGRLFEFLDADGDRQINETSAGQGRAAGAAAAHFRRRQRPHHRGQSVRLGAADSPALAGLRWASGVAVDHPSGPLVTSAAAAAAAAGDSPADRES